MVDSKSWIKNSGHSESRNSQRRAVRQRYGTYGYNEYLSFGCECIVCDDTPDAQPDMLPVVDFNYRGADDPTVTKILIDDFYVICSPVVRGYALNERKWGMYDVHASSRLRVVTNWKS
jgi:hypothetical protein